MHRARLTSAALKKSKQMICEGSPNATFSPASESGAMPLEKLDGQMILPCGPAPAPARVSVRAGTGEASQISVTYGLHVRSEMYGEGIHESSEGQGGGPLAGSAFIPDKTVRTVRNRARRIASPSQRSEPEEQRTREHPDTLSCLSQCCPSGTCERCGDHAEVFRVTVHHNNRVGRLRGYGNCIVAQAAQGFVEAYLEISG